MNVEQGPPEENNPSSPGYSLRMVLRSSLLYSISDLVLRVIGLFLIPIYTRVLTPDDYGIIGYTTALTQILSPLVGLGLVSSFPVLYHSYQGQERKRLISTVINFTFIYSLGSTLLIAILGRPVFDHLTDQVVFNPYILLALWTLFFTTFYYLPLGIFNMNERTTAYVVYSIGLSLIGVFAAILLVVVLRLGALGVLWAGFISGAIGMVVALVAIRSNYLPVIDWDKLKAIFGLALPALPHLFSGTLWRFADRFFLTGWVSLSATGIYSLAMTVSSAVLIILGGATTALNPLFYRRANQNDPTLPADWARLSSLFILGAALMGLGLAVMGPELIQILTPSKYHTAIPLLPTLVLGQVIVGLYWLVSPIIGYTRKTWVYPMASFPAVAANILLNVYLVPRYGAVGAAWAMVGAACVQFMVFFYFSQRFYPVPYEYGQIGKIVVLSAALFTISRLPIFAGFWLGLFKLVLLMLLPMGLLAWRFFSLSELGAIQKWLRNLWVSSHRF